MATDEQAGSEGARITLAEAQAVAGALLKNRGSA